ncbi:MAG: patatin-like phospholipase family protein [Gemmatimonadota bacterium]
MRQFFRNLGRSVLAVVQGNGRQDSPGKAAGTGDDSNAPGIRLAGVNLGPRPWLVLGGGGLRGLGHLGGWKALLEGGFVPAGILGTSIGALVGAGLASGRPLGELVEQALELKRGDLVRVYRRALWVNGIRASSVLRGDVLRAYVAEVLPAEGWSGLELPLQVNAVELGSGRTHWFGPGARTDASLLDAVLASASLPVLYPPVRLPDELYYIDGGAGDALPLERAWEVGATGIVALDVGSGEGEAADGAKAVESGLVGVHQRVFSIMSGRRRRESIANWKGPPLIYIRPRLDGYGTFDFQHLDYFLEEGERAVREALEATGASDPVLSAADPSPP